MLLERSGRVLFNQKTADSRLPRLERRSTTVDHGVAPDPIGSDRGVEVGANPLRLLPVAIPDAKFLADVDDQPSNTGDWTNELFTKRPKQYYFPPYMERWDLSSNRNFVCVVLAKSIRFKT